MDTIDSLQWRYAVKKFDDSKTLSDNQITILKNAFNLTATSYGLQTLKLVIVNNKEIREKLVQHSWNQQQVIQASHLLVICVPKKFDTNFIENHFNLVKEIRKTPDEILNPFKDRLIDLVKSKSQEELFLWNKNQAYIALGNLLTVCAVEKIDSCSMEGFIPDKYDEILELEKHNLTSILVLPVGYRADDDFMKDEPKVRKDIKDTIIEIN